ncbi:endophilin-b1 [Plakobranchus ocellatus]|uniref:Endophilin-b1 n=1 Tax=Plakobranchus ocellatus TaxID=259542 RepID=A0AAV3ZAG5_9GAST|nr:endophilin-b1 [Plakobranchus ocellatus]
MDNSTCGVLCQHPGCWATRRRQARGLTRSLPPLKFNEDSSDDEIQLPTQSVCNLLEDYGESPHDRYPLSTGGRPSHTVEAPTNVAIFSPQSLNSSLKLEAPHNTTASLLSKPTRSTKRPVKRNPRLRLVEVQEVFDRDDLRAQWDETFVTKQYYVWMPNPVKRRRQLPHGYKECTGISTAQTNPVFVKDLTECMIPEEIEQKREGTILFDEWPVLKKKQPRTKSPSKTPRTLRESQEAILDSTIDRDGVNELLALPKDTLMKVLEHTKKSDFTTPGRLQAIVQHVAQDDERARLALGARNSFKHKQLLASDKRAGRHQVAGPERLQYYDQSSTKPVYQLDTNADEDHGIIDRLSSINTPVRKKKHQPLEDERGQLDERARPESEADSVETFPRYAHPLPGIREPMAHPKPAVLTQRILHYRGKVPSISLGLPELPSGIKTTKAFNYKRQDLDFSLVPVITPPSSYRSSEGAAFSEHGTTLKVNVSSTMPGMPESQYRDDDMHAIHRVSPALSTNVPVPPAGTPATFAHGSPTKSAPAAPASHLQQQYSWDTTRVTINWSQSALPPSRGEARGDSAQIARMIVTPQGDGEGGLERDATFGEERALDTINETAREGVAVEGAVEELTPMKGDQGQEIAQKREREAAAPTKAPTLHLETSTLKRIGAGESPRQKSARSVESCPSPEQWPLISESSFENIQRPSVSEPALSARSDRRRPISRDNRRDLAARRAMDDNKMKTESPAPPPPSPEPKDHSGEARARKDLRSRDSLTMAPLFEVAELDEGSPVREGYSQPGKHTNQSSRTVGHMHSKKIEVTVPAEREDIAKEEDKEEKGGEMISQMTVMHVIPKGRGKGERRAGEMERVQETFLNVDIPAEDVSSLKAEHGSSHQEDISSNDTVVKSQTTGSEASATPRAKTSILEMVAEPDAEQNGMEREQTEKSLEAPGEASNQEFDKNTSVQSARDKGTLEMPNSHRDLLDVSTESPELLCDSARFISHEQVSPVEGENGDGGLDSSHRFELGGLEGLEEEEDALNLTKTVERKESLLGNLTRRLDKDSSTLCSEDGENRDEESVNDYGRSEVSGYAAETKSRDEVSDAQPPGVFFFQGSSPSESSHETQGQEEAITDTASKDKTEEEDFVRAAGDSAEKSVVGEKVTEAIDTAHAEETKENSEEISAEESLNQNEVSSAVKTSQESSSDTDNLVQIQANNGQSVIGTENQYSSKDGEEIANEQTTSGKENESKETTEETTSEEVSRGNEEQIHGEATQDDKSINNPENKEINEIEQYKELLSHQEAIEQNVENDDKQEAIGTGEIEKDAQETIGTVEIEKEKEDTNEKEATDIAEADKDIINNQDLLKMDAEGNVPKTDTKEDELVESAEVTEANGHNPNDSSV